MSIAYQSDGANDGYESWEMLSQFTLPLLKCVSSGIIIIFIICTYRLQNVGIALLLNLTLADLILGFMLLMNAIKIATFGKNNMEICPAIAVVRDAALFGE